MLKNKSLKHIGILALSLLLGTTACTDLDVEVKSAYTSENFPTTAAQYLAATGPIYVQLRTVLTRPYWFMQELSTDEAVITARDGNWFDGGQYMELSNHTWNAQNPFMLSTWQWAYKGVNLCNDVLELLAKSPEGPIKTQSVAEVRATRALYYFFLMDLYGNIAIVPENVLITVATTTPRKEVFAYIEQELKEAIPGLSPENTTATYGRPTQWMAQALLAKMYLNAEVYTGTSKYTEAIEACNAIMKSGKFNLHANYMEIFGIKNGPQIPEIIFAVPFDGNSATGQYFARYSLHPNLQAKYGIPFTPSNAMRTWGNFYALYNEPTDIRNDQWLAGKQYNANGSPIMIKTTKVGLDNSYTGSDGKDVVNYHLEFTPELVFEKPAVFDLGGDELSKANGVRNIKYYPDNTVTGRDQSNDYVMFRYADILLMKAEAILRGGVDPDGSNPTTLVNQIRNRAKVSTFGSVDLKILYEERSREMAWEGWRRNDMIRFGMYENAWGLKTNTDVKRRLYPIPTNERSLNPNLQQNEGY